jgi:spore coat protein U-like protein
VHALNRRTISQRSTAHVLRLGAALVLVLRCATAGAGTCTIQSINGLSFGNYNPLGASPMSTNGSINLNCQLALVLPLPFTATISLSTGSSFTYASRRMAPTVGASRLNYNIYLDPTYSTVFGDGSAGTQVAQRCTPLLGLGCGSTSTASNVTMCGLMPAGQDVAIGSYLDSIVVTVTF